MPTCQRMFPFWTMSLTRAPPFTCRRPSLPLRKLRYGSRQAGCFVPCGVVVGGSLQLAPNVGSPVLTIIRTLSAAHELPGHGRSSTHKRSLLEVTLEK